MLNKNELKPAAEVAFVKEINQLVDFIADRCWDSNLLGHINEINDLLCAAADMEISAVSAIPHIFNDDEIAELTRDLKTLRTLKMKNEAKAHLIKALVAHHVSAIVFASKDSTQEA